MAKGLLPAGRQSPRSGRAGQDREEGRPEGLAIREDSQDDVKDVARDGHIPTAEPFMVVCGYPVSGEQASACVSFMIRSGEFTTSDVVDLLERCGVPSAEYVSAYAAQMLIRTQQMENNLRETGISKYLWVAR